MSIPDSPTYLDIVEILEARIHAAATKSATADDDEVVPYGPGTKIPTHEQLEQEFGVGRQSVSKAIGILKDRGLLYSRPPRGVYVAR